MKSPLALLLAAGAVLGVAGLRARAQDIPAPPSSVTVTTARPAPGITLDFPGGTIDQFIAALASSRANFNVVAQPADLGAILPPLSVRHANTFAFAQALDSLLQVDGLTLGGEWSSNVFTIEKLPADAKGGPATLTQSCQLSLELKQQSLDSILDAIRTAWTLDPAHNPDALRLKFHPATQLLLISGPPDAVRIALNVIHHLSVPPAEDEKPDRLAPAPVRH